MTQDQVAELTAGRPWQLSRSAIGAIERGDHQPGLLSLIALCRILYVDPLKAIERAEFAGSAPAGREKLSHEQLERQARDRFWSGDFHGALEKYEKVSERLTSDPPEDPSARARLLAETELRRAATLRGCGSLLAAKAAAERAVSQAEGFHDLQALSLTLLGAIDHKLGLVPIAVLMMDRALELAATCNETVQAHAWSLRGRVLAEGGHFEEAMQAYLKAGELFRKEDDVNQTTAEGNVGECLRRLGRLKEARVWFRRALELARRQSVPYPEARSLIGLGQIALEEGLLDEAEKSAGAALRIARPREHWLHIFRAEWLKLLIARRRHPGAAERNRVALLKKLLVHLGDFADESEVIEFRAELEASARESRKGRQ